MDRILRAIFALLLAVTVAGCASPGAMQPVPHRTGFTGFATLANVGTFEWTAAPTWTRLAQLRHNAARALTNKTISVDVAKNVQARADLARSLLDQANAADKRGDAAGATDQLRWAIAAIDDAEIYLRGKP